VKSRRQQGAVRTCCGWECFAKSRSKKRVQCLREKSLDRFRRILKIGLVRKRPQHRGACGQGAVLRRASLAMNLRTRSDGLDRRGP